VGTGIYRVIAAAPKGKKEEDIRRFLSSFHFENKD
jgi:hypothetical protein